MLYLSREVDMTKYFKLIFAIFIIMVCVACAKKPLAKVTIKPINQDSIVVVGLDGSAQAQFDQTTIVPVITEITDESKKQQVLDLVKSDKFTVELDKKTDLKNGDRVQATIHVPKLSNNDPLIEFDQQTYSVKYKVDGLSTIAQGYGQLLESDITNLRNDTIHQLTQEYNTKNNNEASRVSWFATYAKSELNQNKQLVATFVDIYLVMYDNAETGKKDAGAYRAFKYTNVSKQNGTLVFDKVDYGSNIAQSIIIETLEDALVADQYSKVNK